MSILATLIFFVVSLIIPNNKLFFALTVIYVCSQLLITKSFAITLLYTFIPLSIYSIGLTYSFTAVPKTIIVSDNYPEGRILSVTFSPYFVLLLSNIGLLFAFFISKKRKVFKLETIILLGAILAIILSATKSTYFPIYSTVFASYWLGLSCLAIFLANNFRALKNKDQITTLITLFFQTSLTILFISTIALFQLIKRSPLGLTIESTGIAPLFGGGADESDLIFRPVGLAPHANMMANELLVIWLVLLTIYILIFQKKNVKKTLDKVLFVVTICFLTTIAISQSRALYISLFVFFLLFLISEYNLTKKLIQLVLKKFQRFFILGMFFSIIIGFIFLQRTFYSLNSFSETGGFYTREKLSQEAIGLFKKSPFLGMGMGMFVPALAENNPTGIISKFPEAVHDGFLLFIVENGLISQLFIIAFYFLIIRYIVINDKKNKLIKKILLISLFVQLIPMFFHPFTNYLTVYTIIVLIIMYR